MISLAGGVLQVQVVGCRFRLQVGMGAALLMIIF